MNVLVTAGPTREHFDDVWFLSNPSSGRTGYTIAGAFALAGHEVTLISGPTTLKAPSGVKLVSVISADDMRQSVTQHIGSAEVVIMAAAPVDYRPAGRQAGKMKKSGAEMVVKLVKNPDILKEIGENKGGRILVGFALEATDLRSNALKKLKEKNLDLIVGNSPAAFAGERTSVEVFGPEGVVEILTDVTKEELAGRLLVLVEKLKRSR
jgi:phosphopantothenoylcysteine decarboxylase / phosphopantothenate---cysteine ligase